LIKYISRAEFMLQQEKIPHKINNKKCRPKGGIAQQR
jgi:hypothetical protein